MRDRSPMRAVVFFLLVLAGIAAVGIGAYRAGERHGAVEVSRTVALPLAGVSTVYVWPGPGPWHGGYFPVFPLIAGFVLVAFVLRGGPWRRGACGPRGPWRRDGLPPAFEEWHRRAHERMAGTPPPDRTA